MSPSNSVSGIAALCGSVVLSQPFTDAHLCSSDPTVQTFWPPRDPIPNTNPHRPAKPTRSQRRFKLPESPWTYDGDGFNPDLQPSNALRQRNLNGGDDDDSESEDNRPLAHHYNVPPYHPSYRPVSDESPHRSRSATSFSEGSEGSAADFGPVVKPDASDRVAARMGPEGWEVRQPGFRADDEDEVVDNKQIFDVIKAPDRYRRYVSEHSSTEESELWEGDEED